MKKVPYSLLSGIMAIALFFAPFASSVTFAAEDSRAEVTQDVRDDNYGENVRDDNYGDTDTDQNNGENVRDDNYVDTDTEEDSDLGEWYEDEEWDGKYEFETVTGETYYRYYLDGKTVQTYQDKDGNVRTEKTATVSLDKDAIELIKDHATFSTVKGTLIKFPKAALEQILNSGDTDERLYFHFTDVTSQYADSLSEAIQFTLFNGKYDEYGYKHFGDKLDTPVTITFFVDKDKVKNWEDLTLVYVDEDGNKKYYPNQVKSINPDTGEVVVEVYHFSTYYIAEVAGQGAGAGVIVTAGQESSTPGEEDNGQGGVTVQVDNNGQGGVTVQGDNGSLGTDGKTLPVTATNSYNLLIAGAFILALGLGATVLYRRKQAL